MKLLLTAVAAIGFLASVAADAAPYYDSAPRTAPAPARLVEPQQPLPEYWECGLIQVSPPDHDRDPGFKINLVLNDENFYVGHTMISGKVYSRGDQYDIHRIWVDGNLNWSGRSYKNPAITMVGTFGKNRATGRVQYVERIYKNNRLETTVVSTCHVEEVGD